MSGVIQATNLQTANIKSATGNAGATIASNGDITMSASRKLYAPGHILQVSQAQFLGNYNFDDGSYQDISNGGESLSVSITPSSTSSKILVKCVLCASANSSQRFGVRIVRDGNMIFVPTSIGSRTAAHVFGDGLGSNKPTPPSVIELLDVPSSTSALTYKVQAFCESDSFLYINQCQTWDNDSSKFGAVSTLTVMEVAG